jgi:hypothetical protein
LSNEAASATCGLAVQADGGLNLSQTKNMDHHSAIEIEPDSDNASSWKAAVRSGE